MSELVGFFLSVTSALVGTFILTISGFIFSKWRNDDFQIIIGPEQTVEFRNNTLHAIVIGGSRGHCEFGLFSEISARGDSSGILIKPRDSLALRRGRGLSIGNSLEVSFLRLPLWRSLINRYPQDAYKYKMDPMDIIVHGSKNKTYKINSQKWRFIKLIPRA